MKHIKRKFIVVTAGVTVAFVVGQASAQPARLNAPPQPVPVDQEKEAFMADLGAAVKFNDNKKMLKLLDEATGNAKLTDALISKSWDFAYNVSAGKIDPAADRREVMQTTFLIKQQQRQIELLEEILAELKKAPKPRN